jgi:hypothetical protein
MMMRLVCVSAGMLIALMACAVPACAQSQALTPSEPSAAGADPASEQEHIRSCAADAASKSIDGDARDSFMRTCLSRKIGAGNLNAAQQKMDSCKAEASERTLVGDARDAFITTCLKPPAATPPAAPPAAS